MGVFGVAALVAALLADTLLPQAVGAQYVDDAFELDGNPQDVGTGKPEDWSALLGAASGARVDLGGGVFRIAQTAVPIPDPEASDVTYYKGGGSKDEREISGAPTGVWLHSGTDVAPDKNSILNAAAAAYEVPDGPDGTSQAPETNPDLVLNFTLDRLANDGDAVAGFWFFKNRIGLSTTDPTAFTGTHAPGDVLVVSDFTNGGAVSKVRVYKWIGGRNPLQLIGGTESGDTPLLGGSVVQCGAPDQNPYVCATVNRGATAIPTSWDFTPKSGTANTYPTGSFYEGGINISAIVPDSDECFASFLGMTRSSTSTTAQLKDFVLGDLPICQPSTKLSASPSSDALEVAVVGDTVHFDFVEENDGNVPLSAVKVTTTDDDCVPGANDQIPQQLGANGKNLGDTDADGLLDSGEKWKFRCSFSKSTPVEKSFDAVGFGTDPANRVVTFCTTSATLICDAEEKATAKAAWIEPGTELSVSASPTTPVKLGDTVTFTITEKNDGVAPSGYNTYLDLTSVGVSTDSTGCNSTLTRTAPTDAADQTLSLNEVWTYTCTVTAPSDDFTLVATGIGTVLAGSSHAREVTFSASCTNASGTATTVGRFCDSEERARVSVTVISPSTTLDVTASAIITYTFKEKNDSTDAPLTPPVATSRESVISTEEASACDVSGVVYRSGDTDADKILDPGETWVLTCEGSLAGPNPDNNGSGSTSKTVTGVGHGKDTSAAQDDVTYCGTGSTPAATESGKVCDTDERDRAKVTITYQPRGADPASS